MTRGQRTLLWGVVVFSVVVIGLDMVVVAQHRWPMLWARRYSWTIVPGWWYMASPLDIASYLRDVVSQVFAGRGTTFNRMVLVAGVVAAYLAMRRGT